MDTIQLVQVDLYCPCYHRPMHHYADVSVRQMQCSNSQGDNYSWPGSDTYFFPTYPVGQVAKKVTCPKANGT